MNNRLPFDANDFSLQARSALGALQHVMQVVINAGALLEQQLGHSLEPPAPRRFLYPRDPEKTAATGATPLSSGELNEHAGTDAAADTPEAHQLRELHARPSAARFTSREAALYLNTTEARLRTWRWQRRGPAYDGTGRFTRYTKGKLDRFMAT
jgi:hypothetical protein